jgi:hypothetical protein
MLRKYIFIGFFLVLSFNAFPNFEIEEFFSLEREMRGVKMITENLFSKWKTVSYFDREGLLLRKINYYKNKMRADYRYEYSISDTLLEIKEKEHLNINNNPEWYIVSKYYYNHLKQCYKRETYSSSGSSGGAKNFIYRDEQLYSYEVHSSLYRGFFYKYVYDYDGNQRTEQMYEVSGDLVSSDGCKSTSIYQNGKLVDLIHECDDEHGAFTGVVCWSSEKMNKVHIRYSNFDKRRNWTKSYFITEKGRVFRSKRKIGYW